MLVIVWYHVKQCVRDCRARRLGDLEIRRGPAGQVIVENESREWRLR